MTGILAGFFLYFAIVLGIGFAAMYYRPIKSIDDFILGQRTFGSVVSGLAAGTTLASGYAFIGLVAMGYQMGFLALYQAIFCPILDFVCWRFLGPKMRRYSEKYNVITPVEMLAHLRGDPYNLIKIIGGLVVGVFMFVYLGSNFMAGGKAAHVLNVDYNVAVIGSSILVILYTMSGGATAVYWTDALQGALMILLCIIMPVTALNQVGGFSAFIQKLYEIDPILPSWSGGKAGWPLFVALWMWTSVAVGFLGQPQSLQKFITIESEKRLPAGAFIAVFFNMMRQYFPLILGMCGRILFPTLSDPEYTTPTFISQYFPNLVGGLLLAAIFAAIMSTTDSLLLQGTSELVRNVLQHGILKNKQLSKQFYERASRVVTLLLGVTALILALLGVDTVFFLVLLAFAGLASSIGPAMFAGFYWRRTTSWGILAGIITGTLATFIWYNGSNKLFGLHEGLPSFIIASIAVVVVSLLTKPSDVEREL
jgi:SSS family solute:Na+ symporter